MVEPDNIVLEFLCRIDRRLENVEQNPDNPQLVLTVWGIGYKFSDEQ